MPVLQPYISLNPWASCRSSDLLDDFEKARGHRASLDSVARATVKEGKSRLMRRERWFFSQEGRMEQLKKYCL